VATRTLRDGSMADSNGRTVLGCCAAGLWYTRPKPIRLPLLVLIMPRVIHLHLRPTPTQSTMLQHTLETVNDARNLISAIAWYTGTFSVRALDELCRSDVRERFGLSAAIAHRCVASVAAHYRHDPQIKHTFRPHASIPYDRHTLRIDSAAQTVTIWTVIGSQTIPFDADGQLPDDWQRPTLTVLSGNWYLLIIVPSAVDVAGKG
jgi:putative transposase